MNIKCLAAPGAVAAWRLDSRKYSYIENKGKTMTGTNNTEISPAILKILANRGITDPADISEYMSPIPKKTYDPFLMKGMDEASDMIIEYARGGRRICVYGDYDADGVTSVTLMMTLLGELGADAWYYIPSRFEEGYGLNRGAIYRIAARGTELVITVDNGCVAFDEVAYIKEKGMAVIVTDHHNVEAQSPDCLMLNPKQSDDDYPFSFLCGCGVAFKLAQAITRKTGIDRKKLNRMLDIVGIATVGDIVPLVDENRTLVKYGMDRIRRNERPGLSCLLDVAGIKAEAVGSYNIAFGIVPYINSCGRMKKADMGVELLTGTDLSRDRELAATMKELNTLRRSTQDAIYDKAVKWIEAQAADAKNYGADGAAGCDKGGGCADNGYDGENASDRIPYFILYYAGDAHEGVTGIVAGKIKEKYYRPVVIVTDSGDGVVKGTGRSVPGIDLHALLSKYSDLFLRFGGHAGACGFSMNSEHIDHLRSGLNEDVKAMLEKDPTLLTYTLVPDAVITGDEVTLELARDVRRMEPFGEGNPRPVFLIKDITVKNVRKMGSDGQYRKFSCMSAGGRLFDAVCFDTDVKGLDDVDAGSLIDIAGEVDENIWNGRSSVQVVVRDIEFS